MIMVLILIVIFIAIGVVWGIFIAEKSEGRDEEIGALDDFSIGKYVGGLPGADDPTADVECAVTEDNLVFFKDVDKELGRIPRSNVTQIIMDDKTVVAQRLTVTRMLTLGIFSLAAPKKKSYKEFCVVIDWQDNRGLRHNTIFEFSGNEANKNANKATNQLRKYIIAKNEDVKICPYCAETIKYAAKVCRFCNRELETPNT